MISVLMEGHPFDKKYIELPLCGACMDDLLYYGTLKSDIEYVGVRDGKGRLSDVLRARSMTGEDLRELNLLAYILTRLDSACTHPEGSEKTKALEKLLQRDSYTLKELINLAYMVDAAPQKQVYTGDNLAQQLQFERDAYGPRLDMRSPQPEPWRKISEMEEGRLYWMTGISQFSEYQVFMRQGDSLLQCPAWSNKDKSIRFSEVEHSAIICVKTGLPGPDMTLSSVDDMLDGYYFDLMEGTLPADVRYEYVEFSDLPEGFVERDGTVQQMGGIQ